MGDVKELPKLNIMGGMEDQMMGAIVEKILPIVKPIIEPVSKKLSDYLGNNEKIIIIRQLSGKVGTQVMVFDNSKNFTIQGGDNKKFDVELKDKSKVYHPEDNPPAALIEFYNVQDFIQALLTGEFSKILNDKDK